MSKRSQAPSVSCVVVFMLACGGLRSGPIVGQLPDGGEDAGVADGGSCQAETRTLADAHNVRAIAFDGAGRLYALGAEGAQAKVWTYSAFPALEPLGALTQPQWEKPRNLSVRPDGEVQVLALCGGAVCATRFPADGGAPSTIEVGSDVAWSIAALDDGVTVVGGNALRWYSPAGEELGVVLGGLPQRIALASDLEVSADGKLWIADIGLRRLSELDLPSRTFERAFGSHGHGPGKFDGPSEPTVAASPARLALTRTGELYADDFLAGRIQRLTLDGKHLEDLTLKAGTYPWGLAIDPAGQQLFVSYGSTLELFCLPR